MNADNIVLGVVWIVALLAQVICEYLAGMAI